MASQTNSIDNKLEWFIIPEKMRENILELREIMKAFEFSEIKESLEIEEPLFHYTLKFFVSAMCEQKYNFWITTHIYYDPEPLAMKTIGELYNLDNTPIYVNVETAGMLKMHFSKLNSLFRFGGFFVDKELRIKLSVTWSNEFNIGMANQHFEQVRRWMSINISTLASTERVNIYKILAISGIISTSLYEAIIASEKPNSVRTLPSSLVKDLENLAEKVVEDMEVRYQFKKSNNKSIEPPIIPEYRNRVCSEVILESFEYHGKLAEGSKCSVYFINGTLKNLSDGAYNQVSRYYGVKIPRYDESCKQSEKEYVCDILNGKKVLNNPWILHEIAAYKRLGENDAKFPYICRVYIDNSIQAIIMENYMPENLRVFRKTVEPSLGSKLSWLYQLILTIQFFEFKELVHCDLKDENLVLAKNWFLKVIDFAESVIKNSDQPSVDKRGTSLMFSAPESMGTDLSRIDSSSDIYSFGVLMNSLLMNFELHPNRRDCKEEDYKMYKNCEYKYSPSISNMYPKMIGVWLEIVVEMMTHPDASYRPTLPYLETFVRNITLLTEKLF